MNWNKIKTFVNKTLDTLEEKSNEFKQSETGRNLTEKVNELSQAAHNKVEEFKQSETGKNLTEKANELSQTAQSKVEELKQSDIAKNVKANVSEAKQYVENKFKDHDGKKTDTSLNESGCDKDVENHSTTLHHVSDCKSSTSNQVIMTETEHIKLTESNKPTQNNVFAAVDLKAKIVQEQNEQDLQHLSQQEAKDLVKILQEKSLQMVKDNPDLLKEIDLSQEDKNDIQQAIHETENKPKENKKVIINGVEYDDIVIMSEMTQKDENQNKILKEVKTWVNKASNDKIVSFIIQALLVSGILPNIDLKDGLNRENLKKQLLSLKFWQLKLILFYIGRFVITKVGFIPTVIGSVLLYGGSQIYNKIKRNKVNKTIKPIIVQDEKTKK